MSNNEPFVPEQTYTYEGEHYRAGRPMPRPVARKLGLLSDEEEGGGEEESSPSESTSTEEESTEETSESTEEPVEEKSTGEASAQEEEGGEESTAEDAGGTTLTASKKLAEAGYDSLSKVDKASDEELKEIHGIGDATVSDIRDDVDEILGR